MLDAKEMHPQKFKSKVWPESFYKNRHFEIHIKSNHVESESYECEDCVKNICIEVEVKEAQIKLFKC